MERKLIPWVVLFGLIMITIGHIKRMSKEEEKQAAGYDPLVEKIEKHNEKEDGKFGAIKSFVSKNKGEVKKSVSDLMGNSQEGDASQAGEAVPEDGFLVKKDDTDGSSLKYKPLNERTASEYEEKKPADTSGMESLLSRIKDPAAKSGGYYPPTVSNPLAAPTQGQAQDTSAAKPYYPPSAKR